MFCFSSLSLRSVLYNGQLIQGKALEHLTLQIRSGQSLQHWQLRPRPSSASWCWTGPRNLDETLEDAKMDLDIHDRCWVSPP